MKTLALSLSLLLAGCATSTVPASATVATKLVADALALQTIAKDVQTKCGPQFAPVAPIIASILAVAADPYNALSDIMAAVSVIPVLAQDVKAVQCVVTTIRDDIRTMFPSAKPVAMINVEEMANQVLVLLEVPVPNECVASR